MSLTAGIFTFLDILKFISFLNTPTINFSYRFRQMPVQNFEVYSLYILQDAVEALDANKDVMYLNTDNEIITSCFEDDMPDVITIHYDSIQLQF